MYVFVSTNFINNFSIGYAFKGYAVTRTISNTHIELSSHRVVTSEEFCVWSKVRMNNF